MQSGYGEQTLIYKKISFIIEKNSSVQWFYFQKQGFVIFLTGPGLRKRIFLRLVGDTIWQLVRSCELD